LKEWGLLAESHQDAATAPPREASYRRIWLCADDYGISPAVDTAIRDLIVRGRLNATSVMVTAPAFDRSEAISLGILNAGGKRAAIGLHVTLTAPFRPLSKGFRPLREGAFLPLDATLRAAFLRRFSTDRLAIEIASQVKAFVSAFGHVPDFIDGHQHVHLFPQVRDAVLQVMKDAAPNAWLRQCGRATLPHKRLRDRKGLLLDVLSRTLRRRADAVGIRTNPAFAGTYGFNAGFDFAKLFPKFLDRLPEDGVVMCHPGFVDAELRRVDPLTDPREKEYAYLAGDGFPRVLAEHGVALA
jgi:predicted glycoside hydrolase/deacetylase ChbG (UPF0249 family)